MTAKTVLRYAVLIMFLVALFSAILLGLNRRDNTFSALKVVSNEELNCFSKYVFEDYSDCILRNGIKAAVDKETSTIYVSVSENDLKNSEFLNNFLEISTQNEMNFFVVEAEYANAMSTNKPLKVVVAEKNSDEYMQYDLVLTTLPIINLEGGSVGKDKNGRIIEKGDFSIWNGGEEKKTASSSVEWHIRGNSSTKFDKKSLKLSLKRRNDENGLELLDLGYDDEWILNSMIVDDAKIREKSIMDIWNQIQATSSYGVKMSDGEYVELLVNGSYEGLYLLQRQISEKYLELDDDMVLLRGGDNWHPESVDQGYSIEYSSGITDKEIYDTMSGLFYMNDFYLLDMDNWIDVNLIIQFGRMYDNRWLKNSFYVINYNNDGKICIIPWDTDISFGVDYGQPFTYTRVPHTGICRTEYDAVLASVPNAEEMLSQRWSELRNGVLSEDNLLTVIKKNMNDISASGALARDNAKNGTLYGGEDNFENFIAYVQDQLSGMDEIYLS